MEYKEEDMEVLQRKTIRCHVDGREVSLVLDLRDLRPRVDLGEEAGAVPEQMALIARMIDCVHREMARLEARYRRWRANKTVSLLESGDKAYSAEWKIRAHIESDEVSEKYHVTMSKYQGDLDYLRSYMEALRTQARMLQARLQLDPAMLSRSTASLDSRIVQRAKERQAG